MNLPRSSRRSFLKATLVAGAAPLFLPSRIWAAETPPNSRLGIGFIGIGKQMRGHISGFMAKSEVQAIAVCDVDTTRRNDGKKQVDDFYAKAGNTDYKGCAAYNDFRELLARKDIDVVVIATPDHWHTIIALAAIEAGKDVYCEKPLTLTIDEGKHLIKEVRGNKRILQTGSQQRSDAKFRLACELVRNGRLGKMKHVDVVLPAGRTDGPLATKPVPANLDWNFWQGQAKETEYVPERCHQWFRFWLDYSGGTNTDWGAHHNDIALWALNELAPVDIEGKKLSTNIPGGFTTPGDYEVKFIYASGVTQTVRSHPNYIWNGGRKAGAPPMEKPEAGKPPTDTHGVTFHGSDGWLFITRGKIEASNPDILKQELPASAERLYVSTNHAANFFDCVKSRKDTICPVEVGHRSVSACHLAVIGTLLGRKLKWDPQAEQFVGDDEANKMLVREMRKPWGYDAV